MRNEIISIEDLLQIINDLNPKIRNALNNIQFRDREDLEQ